MGLSGANFAGAKQRTKLKTANEIWIVSSNPTVVGYVCWGIPTTAFGYSSPRHVREGVQTAGVGGGILIPFSDFCPVAKTGGG